MYYYFLVEFTDADLFVYFLFGFGGCGGKEKT